MVLAALKTLTWSTVAAAVASALLLAWADGTLPHIANDVMHVRPAGSAPSGSTGQTATSAPEAQRNSAAAHGTPWR